MPARDNVDVPIKAFEIPAGWFLAQKRKISQVVNDVIGIDSLIPVLNQLLIHLGCRGKWAIAISDHVFVTKVGVGGEEDGHSL